MPNPTSSQGESSEKILIDLLLPTALTLIIYPYMKYSCFPAVLFLFLIDLVWIIMYSA